MLDMASSRLSIITAPELPVSEGLPTNRKVYEINLPPSLLNDGLTSANYPGLGKSASIHCRFFPQIVDLSCFKAMP